MQGLNVAYCENDNCMNLLKRHGLQNYSAEFYSWDFVCLV